MPSGSPSGVNVGGGSSTGRALFALCGGLAGAYYGFYLQSKYMEERRVRHDPYNQFRRRRLTSFWQHRSMRW